MDKSLCFILSGRAKIYSQNGETVMREIGPGDFFGFAALFCESCEKSRVAAVTDCSVAYLCEDEVAKLCGLSYDFCRNYIAFLSGRIRFLNERICELTDKTPERKLFRIFLDFSAVDGTVKLPFSMSELANRLMIGRSSLYRAIDSLAAAGIIEKTDKNTYKIKRNTL